MTTAILSAARHQVAAAIQDIVGWIGGQVGTVDRGPAVSALARQRKHDPRDAA